MPARIISEEDRKHALEAFAGGGRDQQPTEGGGDLQAIESLRGIFIDASRNAQPGKAGEPLYRFTADQIAQLRKPIFPLWQFH